jgi:Fe-S-cluster-containing hydrogenase component 2
VSIPLTVETPRKPFAELRSDFDQDAELQAPGDPIVSMSEQPACPHCEAALFKRHCKYVCPQHGVVMDCGDTFWLR